MPANFFSVKITGAYSVEQALKDLEPKLAKKVLRKAVRQGAKILKEETEKEAPKKTGALAGSVKIKTRFKKSVISAQTVIGEGAFKGETWYAAAIEFGTSKMAPNPFMQRAFDAKKDEVARVTEAAIKQGIEDIASETAK